MMQYSKDAVQGEFGTGGIQYKCDEESIVIHDRWDAGQVGCRTGGMRERMDAGKMGCRKEGILTGKIIGACSTLLFLRICHVHLGELP